MKIKFLFVLCMFIFLSVVLISASDLIIREEKDTGENIKDEYEIIVEDEDSSSSLEDFLDRIEGYLLGSEDHNNIDKTPSLPSKHNNVPPHLVYDPRIGGYFDPTDPFIIGPSAEQIEEDNKWIDKWYTKNPLNYDEWFSKYKEDGSVINQKVIESYKLLNDIYNHPNAPDSPMDPEITKAYNPVLSLGTNYLDDMEQWLRNTDNEVVATPVRYAFIQLTKTKESALYDCIFDPTKYWVSLLDYYMEYCDAKIYEDINNIKYKNKDDRISDYSLLLRPGIYAESAIEEGVKSGVIPERSIVFIKYFDITERSLEFYDRMDKDIMKSLDID